MREEFVGADEREDTMRFLSTEHGSSQSAKAAAVPETCPRWGHISAPEGQPPLPRRAGFAFSLASNDGTQMFVVGGGERRAADGTAAVLKKVRVMRLSSEDGEGKKEWTNPAPTRAPGAEHVWRKSAAATFFPYPSGQRGDLYVHGGVFELQNGPVANAVALRVDANADPKATPAHPAFQWFAVVPDGDANAEAADTMTLKHNEQAGNALAPGKLQRATLTHFGTADKALLFGGDDGLTVKGETWTLERTGGGTPESLPTWTWTQHLTAVGEEAPTARTGHAAVAFPQNRGRDGGQTMVMVFGGEAQGGAPVDDGEATFLFNTETARWSAVPRKSGIDGPHPSARTGASLTYVAEEHAVYLFGGCQPWAGGVCFDDLWRYDVDSNEWKEVEIGKKQDPSYVAPSPVGEHNAIPWVMPGSILMFGGIDSSSGHFGATAAPTVLEIHGVCPGGCEAQGTFNNGRCDCNVGWSGERCETFQPSKINNASDAPCLNDCSGQGVCINGGCVCHKGFNGTDCSKRVDCPSCPGQDTGCLNDCSGHGACRESAFAGAGALTDGAGLAHESGQRTCQCASGFAGEDCSIYLCPGEIKGAGAEETVSCSGHGACNSADGSCECVTGWMGPACADEVAGCPANCTSPTHGTCVEVDPDALPVSIFKCVCEAGFTGAACAQDGRCPVDMPSEEACFGHGTCVSRHCKCDEGFAGTFCDLRSCPNDCSGHGACNTTHTGICECGADYGGEDCSKKLTCKDDCSHHGGCWEDLEGEAAPPYDGVCRCDVPFTGDACENLPCPDGLYEGTDGAGAPKSCNGRGKCDHAEGVCHCQSGFSGPACEETCPKKCGGHGTCFSNMAGPAVCDCEPGWRGIGCMIHDACLKNCSGHGTCDRGRCACEPGFSGEGCAVDLCAGKECSKHGECRYGECYCVPGWKGDDCEKPMSCPLGCSGHGECLHGRCYCDAEWLGEGCDVKAECPRECSQRGLCIRGQCQCQPGYTGEDCSSVNTERSVATIVVDAGADLEHQAACNGNCSGHGQCNLGKCFCDPLWGSRFCDVYLPPKCPAGETDKPETTVCSGRGFCSAEGKCSCYTGYSGKDCSVKKSCTQNCNSHGVCFNGRCFCDPGFSGEFCEKTEPCPGEPPCSERGLCINGMCVCEPGFGGLDCATVTLGSEICPSSDAALTCSGHGMCQVGKCFCEPGFIGADCNTPNDNAMCPQACSGRGTCYAGRCICEPGFRGAACGEIVPCAQGCSGHGMCKHGHCFCAPTWGGDDCKTLLTAEQMPQDGALRITDKCPNGCSLHGLCWKGQCMCRAGWLGVDCSRRDKTWTKSDACPNDCRGSFATRPHGEFGMCLFDKCYCYPGFGGPGCDELMPLRCPNDCSDRGICRHGKCFCDLGFFGEGCEQRLECPRGRNDTVDCSGNGICHRGRCDCNPGFQGHMCESKLGLGCKNECNGHGACEMGGCVCDPGYEGDDCGILNAPQSLSKQSRRGEKPRLDNLGARDPDHNEGRHSVGAVLTGAPSGDAAHATDANRKNHRLTFGPTVTGAQFGNADEAEAAAAARASADTASTTNSGSDVGATATTTTTTTTTTNAGDSADTGRFRSTSEAIVPAANAGTEEEPEKECELDCSGRGVCVRVDLEHELCDCEPGFHGQHCENVATTCGKHNDCSGNGVCKYGACFCDPGFMGKHCDTMEPCPVADCSGHGACQGGRCFCDPGFGGDGCDRDTGCPGAISVFGAAAKGGRVDLACSGHGVCQDGQCYCDESHEGAGCAQHRAGARECYQDCNSRGLCKDGACFCNEGFAGVSCEIAVQSDSGELKLLSAAMSSTTSTTSSSSFSSSSTSSKYSFSVISVAVMGLGALAIGSVFGLLLVRFVEGRKQTLGGSFSSGAASSQGPHWSLEAALGVGGGRAMSNAAHSSPFALASSKSSNL
jgi:hypothetical protein